MGSTTIQNRLLIFLPQQKPKCSQQTCAQNENVCRAGSTLNAMWQRNASEFYDPLPFVAWRSNGEEGSWQHKKMQSSLFSCLEEQWRSGQDFFWPPWVKVRNCTLWSNLFPIDSGSDSLNLSLDSSTFTTDPGSQHLPHPLTLSTWYSVTPVPDSVTHCGSQVAEWLQVYILVGYELTAVFLLKLEQNPHQRTQWEWEWSTFVFNANWMSESTDTNSCKKFNF